MLKGGLEQEFIPNVHQAKYYGRLGNYAIHSAEEIVIPNELIETYNRGFPGGFSLEPLCASSTHTSNLIFEESKISRLTINTDHSFTLSGPNTDRYKSNIPFSSYTAGEYLRQEKLGTITIHGSGATDKENNGVLVLGNKGAGKTSTVLALAKYYGYKVSGDDMIAIQDIGNDVLIHPGNKNIRIRPLPGLLHVLGIKSENEPGRYEDRITLQPIELDVEEQKTPSSLRLLVRVSVHPLNQVKIIKPDSEQLAKERIRLKEDFARHIRGLVLMLNQGDGKRGFCDSFDNPELQDKRDEFVEKLVTKQPIYYVYAKTGQQAANLIDSLAKSSD